jgi:hypothetical protein
MEHTGKMDIGRIKGRSADAFIGVHTGETCADNLGLFPGCRVLAGCGGLRDRDPAKVIDALFRLIHAAPPCFKSAARFAASKMWV